MSGWPVNEASCLETQAALAAARPAPWSLLATCAVAGCFVCFPRGLRGRGEAGDPAWAAAVLLEDEAQPEVVVTEGTAGYPYRQGLLALREGPLCESAVQSLSVLPDVLLVNATGRDHPRRAGLALHLGAVLALPTVGVTHRPLLAEGPWPVDAAGAWSPLRLEGEVVGAWVRTRAGRRPLAVHAGWRTDVETAVAMVTAATSHYRTPEPLRLARWAAREARAGT